MRTQELTRTQRVPVRLSDAFAFFADHRPELAAKVHAGRREFLSQFTTYATPSAQAKRKAARMSGLCP